MPSKYSSDHSMGDAAELARRTGLNFRTVPIEPMFDAYMGSLTLDGLAEENLQSRLRGTMLMALSNQEGHIVLAPGNKSELAVGYSTLYGDSVGAYGPIKDVYKTSVFRLAQWRNRAAAERGQTPPIPENSITKPPSAELRPGQIDTDSLPDYPVLDGILELYVDRDTGRRRDRGRGLRPRAWSPGPCGWSTRRSTSGGSTRRGPRSRRRASARTAGCRSPTGGARTSERRGAGAGPAPVPVT